MQFDMQSIVSKVCDAANGQRGVLSTGEALIAALVLDRTDWLEDMGYTIAQTIDRIGPDWAVAIPRITQALAERHATLCGRYAYEIVPRPEDAGGGYHLRLLDEGEEVESRVFLVHSSTAYGQANVAYADAVAAAHAWLDAQAGTTTPFLPL